MDEKKVEIDEKETYEPPLSFGGDYEDENDRVVYDNKILWYMILIEFGIIIVLLISNNTLANKTILRMDLPPKIYDTQGEIDVTPNSGNPLYFRVYGEYYLKEVMNFTAITYGKQITKITEEMTPSRYAYKEVDFLKIKSFIEGNNISQEIKKIKHIHDVYYYQEKFAVLKIDVIAQQSINLKKQKPKDCEYKIMMYRQNSVLYINDYYTTCFEEFEGYINDKNDK